MTSYEKELVNQLVTNKLSEADFLQQFPTPVANNNTYFNQLLTQANRSKDSELLEYALMLGFQFNLFEADDVEQFEKLIVEDWHISHENLASILKQFHSSTSVQSLYEAANLELAYLDYDDSFELARKCIWVLGAIATGEAENKLTLLAKSNNEVIADYAQRQLKRLHNA